MDVEYAGVPISGSPFDIKIYDSSRIIVSHVKGGELNKPCELTIDASGAGEGKLEIAVNEGAVKNEVRQIKNAQYIVSFIPNKPDTYIIDVLFNDEVAPGKSFNNSTFKDMINSNQQFRI